MTIDDKTLTRTLKALGKTPTGIRRKLAQGGVRGDVSEPNYCVVARYLTDTFPAETVEVSGMTVTVNGASVPTPEPVSKFISLFDDLEYPELVRHRDGCTGPRWDEPDWSYGYRELTCSCGALQRMFWPQEKDKARRYFKAAVEAWQADHPTVDA